LFESLAEHNAKVVDAVDRLRLRTRMLMAVCGVLLVAVGALAVQVLR
jgi:flagellar biosynthesis/type III secretory pathway M-ring protein FliF/YscJ